MEFTTTELILLILTLASLGVSGFLFWKMRQHGPITIIPSLKTSSKDSKRQIDDIPQSTLARTLQQQALKIDELEKSLANFKRASTGVNVKWASPREDKAAFMLVINNDSPETIYNINIEIEDFYKECTSMHLTKNACDSRQNLKAFFMPSIFARSNGDPATSRQKFIDMWLQNKLQPIKFTVRYTTSPADHDYRTAEIYFTRDNITKHLKNSIQSSKARLTLVPSKKS